MSNQPGEVQGISTQGAGERAAPASPPVSWSGLGTQIAKSIGPDDLMGFLLIGGTVTVVAALIWGLGNQDRVADGTAYVLIAGVIVATLGVAGLSALGKLRDFMKHDAKGLLAFAVVGSMTVVGLWADHTNPKPLLIDRILTWCFVVFAVGLAELFVLFVVATILGKIDLPRAFVDKVDAPSSAAPGAGASPQATPAATGTTGGAPANATPRRKGTGDDDKPTVSLARLQAFMWTLVVMIIYFHKVVVNRDRDLPTIPAELLMVMGISGAVYLTSKQIDKAPAPPTPPKPPPPPQPPVAGPPTPPAGG